ncbi:MAG: tetratricopeptide repeat protein [Rudaea sp.]|uniref:serine/threonine-protein kinase n=1 Tax=Rudaea sp. 3F27F6 TaxID=2502208 RepID=UPI0010F73743|nr:serine/threonine-protein kinase [Rudaea sp. 3F27F6]MBR0347723.1 tetratricopeptide repeat protein [Rudaea sp.]
MNREIAALLHEVLSQPETSREDWIAAACADTPQTAAELRELLRRDAQGGGILDRPLGVLAKGLQLNVDDPAQELIGRRIGPYRLTALLGSGGMGVVYLAERADAPFEQTVALKLVRSEKLHGEAQARFARERRILACLSHPHIARLIDGGFDEQGHPWLAMEYVDGEPLINWCNARKLGIEERLHLLLDLCDAVEYAHQHAVVHRDIKPSNVLIDRSGTAKLFDFGIAKQLDEEHSDTFATETRARLLTPAYAAPEQIHGDKVTTATDVHALGLFLYELLCGRRAYGSQSSAQFDLLREILERDAPAMSMRLLAAEPPVAADIAAERGLNERMLQRVLRGDLQAIVAKALRKEPRARYRTVAEFGDDLRRYLDGEPVLAVEGARTYRLHKFVAQHRVAVSLAAIAFLCLLTALIGMTWLGHELRLKAERADQQSRTAVATRDFLLDLFKAASPERTLGKIPDAVELVDIGARRAASQLDAQPELQAQLLGTLGNVYVNLGKYDTALATLEKARGISAIASGDDSAATMQLDIDIAYATYMAHKNSDQIRPLLDHVIAVQRQLPVGQRTLLVPALTKLGLVELDRAQYASAEKALREAIDLARSQGNAGERRLMDALLALSNAFGLTQQSSKTVPLLREATAIADRTLPAGDPDRNNLQVNLAAMLALNGQPAEAEKLLRDAVETQKRILGEQHPQYLVSLVTLADILMRERKLDESETLFKKTLALAENLDKTGDVTILSLRRLALVKQQLGDPAAALPYAERALEAAKGKYGEDNANTLDAGSTLVDIRFRLGEYAQAEAMAHGILARTERLNMAIMTSTTSIRLGQTLRMDGRPAEGMPYLRRALDTLNASRGERNLDSLTALLELAKAQRDASNFDAAREQAQKALRFAPDPLPADDSRILQARAVIAQLDYLQGRCSETSLSDLETLRKRIERDTPKATAAIAGVALTASLCKRQMQGHAAADAENEAAIRAYAKDILQTAIVDPFSRKLAKQELGTK